MGLIEHAERELRIAGYDIHNDKGVVETDKDYADAIGIGAYNLIKEFVKQGHSGFSAQATLRIFNRLVNHKPLTDTLSDNPEEWEDMSDMCEEKIYQSKRNPSCFTYDMKNYFDIDDPENNIMEKDESGELTGYWRLKPLADRKLLELEHVG